MYPGGTVSCVVTMGCVLLHFLARVLNIVLGNRKIRLVMKRYLYILPLLLVFIFSLQAQTPAQIQKLERDINRLHEKVIQAKRFSTLFSDPKMTQMVHKAEQEYFLARDAFQQKKYFQARNHVKMGFTILARLYRIVRNNPFFKNKFKEKLDRKIQEAERVVASQPSTDAQELLNRARYFRQQAVQFAERNQPELAMKNYFLAIFFADNAIRTVTGGLPRQVANLDRYFENTNAMLMHARDLVQNSSHRQARQLLDQAETEYRKAYQLYDNNHPRQAFVRLQIVNRLIYRILDLLEKTPASQKERLQDDIRLLEENLVSLKSSVEQANLSDAQRLYQRIAFLIAQAREKYNSGNYAAARQRLNLARRLFLQLHRRLNRTGLNPEAEVRNQLQTAQTMYAALEQNSQEDPLYSRLLSILQENLHKAQSAYAEKDFRTAIQHLKIFNRLAIKMNRFVSYRKKETQGQKRAQQVLDRLKELLQQNVSWKNDEILKIRYQNAESLYQLALQARAKGNDLLCGQLSQTAIAILTK